MLSAKLARDGPQLQRLSYFDPVACTIVKPMHNLFAGTAKRMADLWLRFPELPGSKKTLLTEKGLQEMEADHTQGTTKHLQAYGFESTPGLWPECTSSYDPTMPFRALCGKIDHKFPLGSNMLNNH